MSTESLATDTTDHVLVAVSQDGLVRARIARTTVLCGEVTRRHKLSTLATHALGRALTCAALYPASWKDCDRVALQWSGGGPLGTLYCEVRAPGVIRGYVKNDAAVLWGADARGPSIGRGLLPAGFVGVLTQRSNGTHGQGQVPLVDGEVHSDLESFFVHSEQVETRLHTHVIVDENDVVTAAVGVLVQALPGAAPERLAGLVVEADATLDPHAHLARLFGANTGVNGGQLSGDGESGFRVLEAQSVVFGCPCSRERALAGMMLLGNDGIIDCIVKDGGADVRCEFCGEGYHFTPDELLELVQQAGGDAE
jgi:molecular chaperone Hsp33